MDLDKMLNNHQIKVTRCQRLKKYYVGDHDILKTVAINSNKPNNKLTNDYPGYIVDTIVGYFAGKPIRYTSKTQNDGYIKTLADVHEANNEQDHNAEMTKNMAIYGESYELLYLNEEGEVRFRVLEPTEIIPKFKDDFSDTLEYAIRVYKTKNAKDEELMHLEVYYEDHIEYYEKEVEGRPKLKEIKTHYFGRVPVVYYINNDERLGDFEKTISLIDEYDKRSSECSNELENWRNAYLKLKNMSGTDDNDLKAADEQGVFKLDEDQDVEYLTKQVNDTFIQNNLKNTDANIHKFSKVPNLSDENFAGNLSGVAIEFKLWPLEQIAATKERKFKTGLKRRLKLITTILNIKGANYDYKDIAPTFVRNIPQNINELITQSKSLKGTVDDETILSRLPFIEDPTATLKKLEKSKSQEIGYPQFEEDPQEPLDE